MAKIKRSRTKRRDFLEEGQTARYYTRWSQIEDDIVYDALQRYLNGADIPINMLAMKVSRRLRQMNINRTVCACENRLKYHLRNIKEKNRCHAK